MGKDHQSVLKADRLFGGGLPPGTTIDELHWYSRKRVHDAYKRDNLSLERGSLKDIVSEYTRSFQDPPAVARSLSNLADIMENEKVGRRIRRCSSNLDGLFGNPPSTLPKQRKGKRHFVELSGLQLEGDMLFETETNDKFVQFATIERPELLRRETELRLEGAFNTISENRDKFVPFAKWERPLLVKKHTNLHLEGEQHMNPEYKDVFIDFPRGRATMIKPNPMLQINKDSLSDICSETVSKFIKHAVNNTRERGVARPSNLKCEGDLNFMPEYSTAFKTLKTDRVSPMRHQPNLKLEGDMFTVPEYREKYKTLPNVKIKAIRHSDTLDLNEFSSVPAYVPSRKPVVPSLVLSPETPSVALFADKSLNRSRPPTPQRLEPVEIKPKSRPDSKRGSIDNFTKFKPPPSPIPLDNKSSSRPSRSQSRRNWPNRSSSRSNNHQEQNTRDESSEHHPRYINYVPERPKQILRQPENFMEDGKYCQPEYRKAYMDYLIREKLPRNLDDEVMNDAEENYDSLMGTDLINSKTQDLNINDNTLKPSSRRASIGSSHSSPRRKRSSSPTYKLQVTNVDVPKKGFGRQNNNENPVHEKSHMRSVSPSWYMKQVRNQDDQSVKTSRQGLIHHPSFDKNQSFVVLDKDYTNFGTRTKHRESPWYRHAKY